MASLSCFKSKRKPKSFVLGLVSLLDSGAGQPHPSELIQGNKSRDCLLDQFSHSPHLEEYQRPLRPEASVPILTLLHHKDLLVHWRR